MSQEKQYLHPLHRRTSVWLVLLAWMVGVGAPCVHCAELAGPPAAAPPEVMPAEAEMPADCPLHAKNKKSAPAEPAPAPDCHQPASCCLAPGNLPSTVAVELAPSSPLLILAEVTPLTAAPLPAEVILPRKNGSDRSHAPPAFNRPLRN